MLIIHQYNFCKKIMRERQICSFFDDLVEKDYEGFCMIIHEEKLNE